MLIRRVFILRFGGGWRLGGRGGERDEWDKARKL